MKYFKYIAIVICSILQLSCETNVDASDLLDQQQFIVINGYLSPQDTTLKVQISKSISRASNSPSSNEDLVITNATVTIEDENQNEISLIYSSQSLNYEAPAADLAIIPGQKYFLTAIVNGEEYKSSCTIPLATVTNVESSVTDNTDDFNFGNKELRLKIEDIRDIRNYYIVGAIAAESQVDFEFNQFTTDANRENGVINVDGFFNFFDDPSADIMLNIKVVNAEQVVYEALRATFLNDYNEGDPFFEPVIAPTNIEGKNGFGVFGGYQLKEIERTI